jgi:hypothetical protein
LRNGDADPYQNACAYHVSGLAGTVEDRRQSGVVVALKKSVTHAGRCAMLTLIALLAAACAGGGDTTDPSQAEPIMVSISVSAATLNVGLGQSRTVTVSFAREGKSNSPVTLGVANVPAGVTVTFEPSVVTTRTASITLTIAVAPDATPGRTALFFTLTGADIIGSQPPMLEITMFGPRVTVTRAGPGSGTVMSNPSGINCGGACSSDFRVIPLTLTAPPAAGSTFAGWSGACVATTPICTFTPAISASGSNVVNVTATFMAPSFSLAVAPTSISVPQGTNASATVHVTRAGGFSGAVNLAFAGVLPGLTITPNTVSLTGDSATITIAAALSLGAGNYPITINATAAGVPQQSATLPVKVTPAPGGSGNITLSFASCDPGQVPIWFAAQDGNGAWTRIARGANSTFTFAITSVGGVAFVTWRGNNYTTTVAWLSRAEAAAIATGSICAANPQAGTRSLTTNALNTGTATVTVTLGGAATTFSIPTPPGAGGVAFTLNDFPAGRRDLIAARSSIGTNGLTQLQRLVLRRNTSYPQSATPPAINFTGPESFAPLGRFIALSNIGGDQSAISESFVTANGASESFFESNGTFCQGAGVDCVPWAAVPDSLLQPGDFHALSISVEPQSGNATSGRFAALLLHAPPSAGPASVALGPSLATPSVTSLGTTPNVRMRAQLASQAAYNAAAGADFSQDSIRVELLMTAAYSGGTPATWIIDMPDLSSAGYDPTWGLKTGLPVNWNVSALGGSVLPFLGATPFDGAQIVGAGVGGSPIASMRLIPSRRARFP